MQIIGKWLQINMQCHWVMQHLTNIVGKKRKVEKENHDEGLQKRGRLVRKVAVE